MPNWFVYIILTENTQLYTGITTDLNRRLQEHMDVFSGKQKAKGAKYFRTQKPLEIVYKAMFADRSAASKHEHFIKKLSKAQKQNLINSKIYPKSGVVEGIVS